MEFPKSKKDRIMLAIIGIILLIHLGVYLTFHNKFWLGFAGILSLPFLFVAFLVNAYTSELE